MTPVDPELYASVMGIVWVAVNDPGLNHEARVTLVAVYLILRERGPLADRILSTPQPAVDDPLDERLDYLDAQRVWLRETLAWTAAEQLLEVEDLS